MIEAASRLLDSILDPAYLIIVGPVAVVACLFIWAEHRADKQRLARAQLHKQSLAFHSNPAEQVAASESFTFRQRALSKWEDDPRFRADIARTRTQRSEQTTLARCPLCGAWPGQAHGYARPCRFGGAA